MQTVCARRNFLLACIASGAAFTVPTRSFAAERIKIRDLWGAGGEFSPLATQVSGRTVELQGYMAPPLKPEMSFFVLTRIPMAVCPFCDTEAAWPNDLIVVYCDHALALVNFNELIRVSGRLETGTKTDPETGLVSRVRLMQADYVLA